MRSVGKHPREARCPSAIHAGPDEKSFEDVMAERGGLTSGYFFRRIAEQTERYTIEVGVTPARRTGVQLSTKNTKGTKMTSAIWDTFDRMCDQKPLRGLDWSRLRAMESHWGFPDTCCGV